MGAELPYELAFGIVARQTRIALSVKTNAYACLFKAQEKQIEDCRIALEHLPQEVFVVSEGGANVDRE